LAHNHPGRLGIAFATDRDKAINHTMSDPALRIENVSKQYRLGTIGTGTLSHDLNRFWARLRGKPAPYLTIGQENRLDQTGDGYVWALRDINLQVPEGQVLGIIGKNGAGKSTLLKILSRVTGPTTGQVTINGRLASLLEVGTGFHKELTGRENIFLNGAIMGMTRREVGQKFDEIVAFSGVEKYIDTPVKRYSSGMYVRLAFAVAAHLEPEVLVVDEVLAVGDAEFQKKAIGKMQDVSRTGRTVLFVSHNMAAVKSLCSHGVLLQAGQVAFQGPVDQAVQRYLSQFAQEQRHKEWTFENAPGDEVNKLLEAKISIPQGTPIYSNDDFEISFVFHCASSNHTRLDVTVHLMDEMNNVAFVTSTAHQVEDSNILEGTFRATCHIPGKLMNEGTYFVHRLLLVKDLGFGLLDLRDVISFEVVLRSEHQYSWKGSKEGVLRPILDWKMERL